MKISICRHPKHKYKFLMLLANIKAKRFHHHLISMQLYFFIYLFGTSSSLDILCIMLFTIKQLNVLSLFRNSLRILCTVVRRKRILVLLLLLLFFYTFLFKDWLNNLWFNLTVPPIQQLHFVPSSSRRKSRWWIIKKSYLLKLLIEFSV